ncbi:MAG: hypothetical protein ACRCW0_01990 [Clostridium sp.]
MKFKLHKSLFDLLINVQEVNQYVIKRVEIDDYIEFSIDIKNFREVQLLINDKIVLHGMNNQDTVNDLGLKLYKLYDEILYQKNQQ